MERSAKCRTTLPSDMSEALRGEYERRVAGEAAVSGNKVPAFQRKFGVSRPEAMETGESGAE